MSDNAPEGETRWHLDRRVPIALIATIAIQTFGAGWLFSQMENRVTQLERRADLQAAVTRDIPEKLGRLDEQVRAVRDMLERIDRKMMPKGGGG